MSALRTKVINTALLLQLLPGCCDGGCQVLVELLVFFSRGLLFNGHADPKLDTGRSKGRWKSQDAGVGVF